MHTLLLSITKLVPLWGRCTMLVIALVGTSSLLVACSAWWQQATPTAPQHPWPAVLQQAQAMATSVHPDAVLVGLQVESSAQSTVDLYYHFVFVSPAGDDITIYADKRPGLIMNTSRSTQPVSLAELAILREATKDVHIGPADIMGIGRPFIEETRKQAPLTVPVSCGLMMGSTIKADYGVPAVWFLSVLNKKQHGVLAIDPTTGAILGERRIPR